MQAKWPVFCAGTEESSTVISKTCCTAIAARIESRFERAVCMACNCACVSHGFIISAQHFDIVTAMRELRADCVIKTRFDFQRSARLSPRAAEQPARRGDRLLQV